MFLEISRFYEFKCDLKSSFQNILTVAKKMYSSLTTRKTFKPLFFQCLCKLRYILGATTMQLHSRKIHKQKNEHTYRLLDQ